MSYNAFGSKLGRVHMEHQDFSKLHMKLKGLKRTREGEKKLMTEQMEVVNNITFKIISMPLYIESSILLFYQWWYR